MGEPIIGSSIKEVLTQAFGDSPTECTISTSYIEALSETIEALSQGGGIEKLYVFADQSTLRSLDDDFKLGTKAADLIDTGRLELYESPPQESGATTLVSEGYLVSLITAGDDVAGLITTNEEFTTNLSSSYEDRRRAAERFSLRSPPITNVREALQDKFDESYLEDFNAMLASQDSLNNPTGQFDEVHLSLLLAAKNESLLYDISKWGEDSGVASKATFSRAKTTLEALGLITTEKVPIDVGRPRLRLLLEDSLADVDTRDLFDVAERQHQSDNAKGATA